MTAIPQYSFSQWFHGILLCLVVCLPISSRAEGFTLQDIQGQTLELNDYRGKWVLVNFWATWCPPCLNEIPELSRLHETHKNRDLVVIGIAMNSGSKFKVAQFAQAHGINYPVVVGNRKIASQIGTVDALPTSYLYAPSGKLVDRHAGEVTRSIVEKYIKTRKFN